MIPSKISIGRCFCCSTRSSSCRLKPSQTCTETCTSYYRKSVGLKQKSSRSRYLLLRVSPKVLIQTIAQGIRYRYAVVSNRIQAVGIDRNPGRSIKLSVHVDRYSCEPTKLGNNHRSISSHTYRFNYKVLISGDKKVLFERSLVGSHFQVMLVPKIPLDVHLRKHFGRTTGCGGQCPNHIAAYNTYGQTPKPSYCAPRQVSIFIIVIPIVGPIAYSIGYYTGYEKELNGT